MAVLASGIATDMSEDSDDNGAGVFELLSLRDSAKVGIETQMSCVFYELGTYFQQARLKNKEMPGVLLIPSRSSACYMSSYFILFWSSIPILTLTC